MTNAGRGEKFPRGKGKIAEDGIFYPESFDLGVSGTRLRLSQESILRCAIKYQR